MNLFCYGIFKDHKGLKDLSTKHNPAELKGATAQFEGCAYVNTRHTTKSELVVNGTLYEFDQDTFDYVIASMDQIEGVNDFNPEQGHYLRDKDVVVWVEGKQQHTQIYIVTESTKRVLPDEWQATGVFDYDMKQGV